MADESDLTQAKPGQELADAVGERVEVETPARIVGAAMASAVGRRTGTRGRTAAP
jgi:hypothetical protein